MKKGEQIYNQTYSVVIIDDERIVMLNRQYLPTFVSRKIDGEWADEYVEELLSSSEFIEQKNASKLKSELSKHSTTKPSIKNQKGHSFEFFWIYKGHPTPIEMQKIRAKISRILKSCTGRALEFFE